MRSFRTLAVWLSPLAWAVIVAATCYYPDGSVAGSYNWVPCKSTGTASTCCIPSEGDVCMEDGLCNWVGYYYFRGACTDQTWQDPSCAQVCQGDSPTSWISLQKCTSGDYCCGSGCCTDGTSSQFALNATATVAFTSTSTSSTATTSKKTTTTTSSTRTTSTSSTTTLASTALASTGVTVTAASATSTSGSGGNGGSSGGSSNKDLGVALGVGLAGSIIGVACAVAVFLLIRRDKKRKQQAAEAGLLAPSAPAGPPMATAADVPPLASPAPTYTSPYPSPYPTPSPGFAPDKGGRVG
ncbi:hypothetical protein CONLIGDRAFT_717166 [Coniochaeta ligniaria NRRL 30616]|uniref:Mid2 domain-containing protein n=1 Tax=Coniochaeta ligniaria NRRL 30616 TaxID=1408157 RepID=A0A1J7IGZ0_9PEZI|nr:hypothetical protein CONLIGDRAFT_717166 [Coniochaeta ligniaria NRRL 30616]